MTSPSPYVCANCRQEFTSARSDEEAIEEREEMFPDVLPEEFCIVCDDCWKEMGFA